MGIAAMITSIKFNDRRTKREAFKGWSSANTESQGIKKEPVSEEVLQQIRDRAKRQQKKANIRNSIILVVSIIATVIFIKLLFNYYSENFIGITDAFLYK
ncbi:hypothetical protein [Aquimarina spongiae]|uniref:Uncharacterized protein n=1 Tax=Aquimarina spongiae TaxID=570521 RepID=A0A1M6EDB4_9FLAO|nr:hypothetical protein [Aquimarina spongiae]SHI83310.1 hypothetical protein SAMN04488508_103348 [Aquimarina spongiae]